VYNACEVLGADLLTQVGRLDPIRSRILKDIGIDVWLLRQSIVDPVSPDSRPQPKPQPQPQPRLQPSTATPSPRTEPQSPPGPATQTVAHAALAVTCLVNQVALMLIDNSEPGVSRRLCRDLLAGIAGDWRSTPREVVFTWPADAGRSDGWRAFKAFAEKQLSEAQVRVVLCSEPLARQLPALAPGCDLLTLPALAKLDVEGKRALWQAMQHLQP
jgi:hypothetical protein